MSFRAAYSGIKNFFKRRVTVKYPTQELLLSNRYRGRHLFHMDLCISCGLCAKSCPADAIEMIEQEIASDEKKKYPKIDYGLCIFCGFCVDKCPKNALEHTDFFHLSTRHIETLVYSADALGMQPNLKNETIVKSNNLGEE